MDPASIIGLITASLELAKLAGVLMKAVRKVKNNAPKVDDDINNLLVEVEGVRTIASVIEQHYKDYEDRKKRGEGLPEEGERQLAVFWEGLRKQLDTGHEYVLQQAKIVNGIAGTGKDELLSSESASSHSSQANPDSGSLSKARNTYQAAKDKVEGFKKAYRLMSKEDDFPKISTRLHELQDRSWKLFECVKDTEEKWTNSTNLDIARAVEGIQNMMQQFATERVELAQLVKSNKIDSPNLHFDLPHAASNIFTGRSVVMQMLEDAFFGPMPQGRRIQRRFVVQGQGGTGKTELCLQFAQKHRDSFWGIFHVDGSSNESAERSFEEIAKLGRREPKFKAGRHFLANSPYSWLLIIDGADDDILSLENYFPAGDRGCVLITTRKSSVVYEGTTSPPYLILKLLEEEEAKDVLLRASDRPLPGPYAIRQDAGKVALKLDYFPMALIHAGRTMRKFKQTMRQYLDRFERASRSQNEPGSRTTDPKDTEYLVVYSSNQTSYGELEEKAESNRVAKDAIELLKTFAFFHNENIPTAVLIKAAETYMKRKPPSTEGVNLLRLLYNPRQLSQLINASYQFLTDKTGAVFPSALKWDSSKGIAYNDEEKLEDIKDSVQAALQELEEISFITFNENRTNFRIHNLVHKWMREGPAMKLRHKAYWCQAALNVLANSVPIPSLDMPEQEQVDDESLGSDIFEDYDYIGNNHNGQTSEDDPEDFKRRLFEHIRTAREMYGKITQDILALRQNDVLNLRAPMFKPRLVPSQVITMARFSIVYASCSQWKVARQLQEEILEYLHWLLPRDHELTRGVSQLLVQSYWELADARKALRLQKKIAEACEREKGPDDKQTLQAMDMLGSSYWLAGQLTPAIKYHQKALDGWWKIDEMDPRVFKAMGNLGRDYMRFMEYERADRLYQRSLKGLRAVREETHDDILEAKENVAMNALDSWEYDTVVGTLEQAYEFMQEVYERRRKRLGREHSRTLWSSANLVKVKSALGMHAEADELAGESIDIASRNLGPENVGTLWGRSLRAQINYRRGRYEEAVAENLDVLAIHRSIMVERFGQDHHPDEVVVGRNLALVYEAQGRYKDALECYQNTVDIMNGLLVHGQGHPMSRILTQDMARVRVLTDEV